jgi:outer membrane receptor protein involved in Fe transport
MQPSAIRCSILILICWISAFPLWAQSASSATIVGVVTDSQGAVVPNATVTATNTATGIVFTAKTTGSGNYVFPNLPPSSYDVRVEATSFSPQISKGIKLNIGDHRDLNFKLAAGATKEVIEVTSETPLVESTKTDVSTTVGQSQLENLPALAGGGGVAANDYAQLALSAPGVKMDTSTLTTDLIGPGSINNRANLFNVDGVNITDQVTSGRDGLGASVDEIQEFQVLTNNYNAEYGQAGGLVINAVTKSGSNAIHGDGHAYFRGRNLSASDPFYNNGLFQSAQPRKAPAGPAGTKYCPPGNFVGGTLVSLDGCDRAPFSRQEGGFTVGGPFIKDRLFWFGSYELSHHTLAQTLTPSIGNITTPSPTNDLLYGAKLDYKISNKHNLSMRYFGEREFQDNLIVQTSHSITPDDLTTFSIHNIGGTVGLVSSITPTLVNEARFAFFRTINTLPDKTSAPGIIHTTQGFTSGADFCCPQGGLQKRYQYIDNLTWTHGAHTFKTGFNISYYPWFSLFQQFHFGQYTASGGTGGAPLTPTSFTFAVGPGAVKSKDNIYGFYFQDTWKVTHNLTVNAGLRYDVEAGAFKGGKIRGPNGTCFQGNGLISACSSDYNNWQPRLGFTYGLSERTLFKASFAESTVLAFNNVVLDSLNFDGTTLNTVTTTNPAVLAAFPNAPSPALLATLVPPGSGAFGRVRPISDHLRNPEIRAANFGIQHEFSRTLVAEVQYIGQWGFGLFGERDRNAPPVIPDPAHPGFFYFGDRPNTHFTAIRTNENTRTSHYNGLVVSATKRHSNHLEFSGSYTWSHALTSGEDFFGLSEPGDPTNTRAELGPAFNDSRHAANFNVILDSGRVTDTQFLRWFTNDLGLSFGGQLQSGRPYPFSSGTAGFANGRFFGTGNETQQRPRVLADGTISTAGLASFDGSNALFGPGAVTACMAAGLPSASCTNMQNTFLAPASASALGAADSLTGDIVDFRFLNGNMGRDAGLQSPYYRVDLSLKKTFRIPRAEHMSLEIRADAFNLFNHPNWQGFNGNNTTNQLPFSLTKTGAPAADFFTCTSCMRPNGTLVGSGGQVMHFADIQRGKIDSNLGSTIWGGIGDPSTTELPRSYQLSFHFRF